MQIEFGIRNLGNESMCKMVVLTPKGDGRDFRGIDLMEVLWETVMGLLDRRFTSANRLHGILHGFWAVRGTGTATLKSKLLQQLMAVMESVLYSICLDL